MVHFRLSAVILLAATWSLIAGECQIGCGVSTERVITCDTAENVQRLSCDFGVISVEGALYGRTNTKTCSAGTPPRQLANTECSLKGTVDFVKKWCNARKVCEISTSLFRRYDPCYGIYKYLETNYTCLPAIQVVACEHSEATLFCEDGQVIFVYGANYGRHDQTTCIYRRPPSQITNIYCSAPASKVSERCNGKTSCTVRASNSEFGDPCFGTYKYLEVAYVCEYPQA